MITKTDLNWWLGLEAELDWRFATTYADGAPHEYVVGDRTPGLSLDDVARAAHVIRTYGEPMKFYKDTRVYLVTPMGWKHWDMQGPCIDDPTVTLINRGRVEHVYGIQNMPRTASGTDSSYDGLATRWDERHGLTEDESVATADLLRAEFGQKLWRTLDIGCGTGLPLDLGLVEPVRYVGVDPSTSMLNALVMKHPVTAGVHPMAYAEAEQRRVLCGTRFDTVLALGGAAAYLTPEDWASVSARGDHRFALSVFAEGESPVTGDLDEAELTAARERLRAFMAGRAGRIERIGRFEIGIAT